MWCCCSLGLFCNLWEIIRDHIITVRIRGAIERGCKLDTFFLDGSLYSSASGIVYGRTSLTNSLIGHVWWELLSSLCDLCDARRAHSIKDHHKKLRPWFTAYILEESLTTPDNSKNQKVMSLQSILCRIHIWHHFGASRRGWKVRKNANSLASWVEKWISLSPGNLGNSFVYELQIGMFDKNTWMFDSRVSSPILARGLWFSRRSKKLGPGWAVESDFRPKLIWREGDFTAFIFQLHLPKKIF